VNAQLIKKNRGSARLSRIFLGLQFKLIPYLMFNPLRLILIHCSLALRYFRFIRLIQL